MPRKKKQEGKDRITITLSKEILPLLDRFIDGETIRNRSHAIEYILNQHLGVGVEQAVILAGKDKHGIVQAMTMVRQKPVIGYILDALKKSNVRDVAIVVDQAGMLLKQYVGDGSGWGMRMRFVEDPQSLGTARALSLVKPFVQTTFLLFYSDALAELTIGDFVAMHKSEGRIGTVALTYKKSLEQYGMARMEGNKIVEYSEKPSENSRHGLLNAGIYIFEPAIFEYLTANARSLERDILPQVAAQRQLVGYPFQGKWFDISNEASRKHAEQEWG